MRPAGDTDNSKFSVEIEYGKDSLIKSGGCDLINKYGFKKCKEVVMEEYPKYRNRFNLAERNRIRLLQQEQIDEGFKTSLANIKDGNGKFSESGQILVEWLSDLDSMKFSALIDRVKEIKMLRRQKELEDNQKSRDEEKKKYEELVKTDSFKAQKDFIKARNSNWFECLKIISPDGVMTTTETGSYKDSVWMKKDQKWGRKPKWLIELFKDIKTPEAVEDLITSKKVRLLGRIFIPERD